MLLSLVSFVEILSASKADKIFSSTAYGSGEELHYVIYYSFLTGGRAVLSVNDTILNDNSVFHLKATAKTVGLPGKIFKILDTYESFINPNTELPVKSIRNIREGRYRYYNEVLFDHDIRPDSTYIISQRSGSKYVSPGIFDIVSAFYYARMHQFNDDMTEGEIIELMTYFADEEFPLLIRYQGTEIISTQFGQIECYRFGPITEVGRAFETEDDMHVWISKDENRLPIRVRFKLKVGSFICDLEKFRGLKNPFSSIVY